MKTILRYLNPYRMAMLCGFIIKVLGTFADLGLPWVLAYILDDVVPLRRISLVLWWGMVMVCLAVAERVFRLLNEEPETADAGEIYVDGHENKELTRASLRRAYAMVLQDTWVFGGTIFENIAYGREGATMEEVVAAAKAAHIHSYIMRLPEGYQTVLSENGVNISKGQKQLLTIARAMLLDAKMLILDEATSNVDTRTEIRIQKAMRRLMAGKTCFVIAHRLSTIQHADQILVVNDGDVVEQGTHEELMGRKGVLLPAVCVAI